MSEGSMIRGLIRGAEDPGEMLVRISEGEWAAHLSGTMGRPELARLAELLGDLPSATESVLIDWQNVSHIDFRGMAPVAQELRRLSRRRVAIQCRGIDPYLLAIVLLTLSVEEIELFAGCDVRLPARDERVRMEEFIQDLSPLGVSRN